MATCPTCGADTRKDGWRLAPVRMTNQPVALSAQRWRLVCSCGWSVVGRVNSGYLEPTGDELRDNP